LQEDRILLSQYDRKNIFVDVVSIDGVLTVKLFLPTGNTQIVEIPQSRVMSCLRLKDCDDTSDYGRVGLPLVPECLFDGRFNGDKNEI